MSEDATRLPIIRLWNQILVPLQGEITDEAADLLRTSVLETIYATGADGLVIDLTGVWTVDSHLCSVISRLAAAALLMGTRSIICGMSAEIAMTLQTMGIDMPGVRTALTVEEAFAVLGVRRVTASDADEEADEAPRADRVETDGSRATQSGAISAGGPGTRGRSRS